MVTSELVKHFLPWRKFIIKKPLINSDFPQKDRETQESSPLPQWGFAEWIHRDLRVNFNTQGFITSLGTLSPGSVWGYIRTAQHLWLKIVNTFENQCKKGFFLPYLLVLCRCDSKHPWFSWAVPACSVTVCLRHLILRHPVHSSSYKDVWLSAQDRPHQRQHIWLPLEGGDAQAGRLGGCQEPDGGTRNDTKQVENWRNNVGKEVNGADGYKGSTGKAVSGFDRVWNKPGFFFVLLFIFFLFPVKSLHFNSRRPLILPENVFAWSIFCSTWHTALAQPFPLSSQLRSISALQHQPCSGFEPCLSLGLKTGIHWQNLISPRATCASTSPSPVLSLNRIKPWLQNPGTKWQFAWCLPCPSILFIYLHKLSFLFFPWLRNIATPKAGMAPHQRASVIREAVLFSLWAEILFLSKASKYLKKVTVMIMGLKNLMASE